MYGFEVVPFLRFCVQLSAVIAASASLWGAVFAYRAKKQEDNAQNWYKLAKGALIIFVIAAALFLVGWWALALFVFPISAIAHKDVVHTVNFPSQYIQRGFNVNLLWVSVLGIFYVFSAIAYKMRERAIDLFKKYALWFFSANFLLLSVIISLSSYAGLKSYDQMVLSIHNWHSIFTLGTVIMVDLLFLYTSNKNELKKTLYSFYPLMSVAIWTGLGLDFLSSFLVLGAGFPQTEQFVFNQIVVVVIILNGALLSVRINDKLIDLVKGESVLKPSKKWQKIMHLSGAVSIVSWFTITFLDLFNFTFLLPQFIFVYIVLILCALVIRPLVEGYAKNI